ncbi:hypothetical protein FHR81_002827 [Actinoalloteichus hoggarensis]|uniref:Uncharacterized protein n=1 Tax=Actinoalloteichus hoggarensis TaxID=1470176 RepID=A0A221VYV6_9PSEU|nr:DUF4307 domain-containing protein [Actinoalloteichus hoggarensis]ASO18421.1 hypothetical protein AHOG_03825 [Actinoalloteichus hoggarensis]MBB5921787.1 hypothetical protein [Actinoalloteichus hoggarensis]
MNDTPPSTTPRQRPVGRYGAPARRPSRRVLIVSLGVAVGIGLVASIVAYRNFGAQPIRGEHTAFEITSDDSIELSFQVHRDDPERPAVCVVESRAENGDEVGRREVYVPPAEGSANHTTTLRTSQRPVIGEVFGCSYEVPEYLIDSALTPPGGGMRPSG